MKRFVRRCAFTLAEVMIGMAGTTIIVGALLLSSVELQRSLQASERYALSQADQRRLLDVLSRDMRRAIGVATTTTVNGTNGTKLIGATAVIEDSNSLVLTIPGYYVSNTPTDTTYDQPMGIVAANNYVDYGSNGQHAAGVPVIIRKEYVQSEGCTCYVRIEGDDQAIIVDHAENLHLTVTMSDDGRTSMAQVTFQSPRHNSQTMIAMHDQILLRNIRLD